MIGGEGRARGGAAPSRILHPRKPRRCEVGAATRRQEAKDQAEPPSPLHHIRGRWFTQRRLLCWEAFYFFSAAIMKIAELIELMQTGRMRCVVSLRAFAMLKHSAPLAGGDGVVFLLCPRGDLSSC